MTEIPALHEDEMRDFGENSRLALFLVLIGIQKERFFVAHPLGQKVLGTEVRQAELASGADGPGSKM